MNNQQHPWLSSRWNSIHGDNRNADAFAYPTSAHYRVAWRALAGAAVLFGPSIDRDGKLYLCSGRGRGHSHLHAFSRDGSLHWEADTFTGVAQLDPRVCPFAPLLDAEGGVYVADERYFWCFESDGALRWKTDLHALGIEEGFASAIFSPGGHVGGVSLDGAAAFFHRDTGKPAMGPLWLPKGVPPTPPSLPPGLWSGGLMDGELASVLFPGFFGFGHQVTNTPAVALGSGTIYIPGAGPCEELTVLYGIRERNGALETVFAREFSGRCAVTPSLSPDEQIVYTGNAGGELFAFDALHGTLRWTYSPAGPAASPSVGADGTVYTGTNTLKGRPSELSALDPQNGNARWRRNYDAIAAQYLPERATLEPFFCDPKPRAVINSVQTLGASHLLVVLLLGYTFTAPGAAPMTQPHRVVLASIDPVTGNVEGTTELPDTSEAAVVLDADGTVYTCHASLSSSVFHYGIDPLLPQSHRSPLIPVGGFSALRPCP